MTTEQKVEGGERLVERAVESHLRANGDWNINDWRDVAQGLLAALQAARERISELEGFEPLLTFANQELEASREETRRLREAAEAYLQGTAGDSTRKALQDALASPAPDRPEGEEEWPSDMDPRRSPFTGPQG